MRSWPGLVCVALLGCRGGGGPAPAAAVDAATADRPALADLAALDTSADAPADAASGDLPIGDLPPAPCELGGRCCKILRDGGAPLRCLDPRLACDRRQPGGGRCAPCGGTGGPCCETGEACGNAADSCLHLPDGDYCHPCGGDGQFCCDESAPARCKVPSSRCEAPPGRPQSADVCVACGEADTACCPGSPRCHGAGLICINTTLRSDDERCRPCGTAGTPCCAGNLCGDGSCCFSFSENPVTFPGCGGPSSTCINGRGPVTCGASASCGGCGGVGQRCCGPDSQTVFFDRTCAASGTACMQMNGEWRCTPCGQQGQPCCRGSQIMIHFPLCRDQLRCLGTPQGERCAP